MTINSISFGRQIPLIKCHIKDKEQNKFVPATFYELDCSDEQDIETIQDMPGRWGFRNSILCTMRDIMELPESQRKYKNYSFYILKKDDGQIVGLSEVSKEGKDKVLQYIESSNRDKYKYIGQTMLASIADIAKQEKCERVYIPNALKEAYDFYVKCGFKPCGEQTLSLPSRKAKKLKKIAEANTSAPIINLMG